MRIAETTPASTRPTAAPLSLRRIFNAWWPLAASWLLMGAELPALSAVVARLPDPEIHLAAYGGVVFPLSLIIESPIIMLLAASTALSKDWDSYAKLRRFMMTAGAALTAIHILIAFTPLFDLVVSGLLGVPEEILEPARTGFRIMTPWTWSIAYRRFNQGVLIRFNHPRTISIGTVIRLSADLIVLSIGYALRAPGIVVATSAVAAGVVSEAVYVGVVVRPVLRGELRSAPPVPEALTLRSFLNFYLPLVLTSLLTLFVQPIGSAALSRMPLALQSLAVWPVVSGLVFMFRSAGIAYNEVVVAQLDQPRAFPGLHRFTLLLASGMTCLLLLLTATPLSRLWFQVVSGLSPQLAALAITSMWFALPMAGLSVFQSWYQGALLHARCTRPISESVVIFLVACTALLGFGVAWGSATGLYVGWMAFVTAALIQTVWLWLRSRRVMDEIRAESEVNP
jgi:hypothetical protein